MGKIVEKKKKKKGRPSLLDLQKRSLKQQQQQLQKLKQQQQHKQQQQLRNNSTRNPNPNSSLRRSSRRNPNPNPNPNSDDDASNRRQKKLDNEDDSGSESDSSGSNLKKRKIDSIATGSEGEKHTKQSINQQESKLDDGPSTPLPDIKLLLFILERLQKKDTYGVFAEPVDPEELPDYNEIIENPMDFSTVRKKLLDGEYTNLEEFEKDVFLICSNAMQYNAPDTIYFRQARSIQELAKKDFENLRQDSDDNEPESAPKVVRRGRPPTKNFKRPPGRPPLERPGSNFSETTPAATTNRFNHNDTSKGLPVSEKQGSADLFAQALHGSRFGEACVGWSAERSEDMTGSGSKGLSMKNWKKNNIICDENRRHTYKQTCAIAGRQEPSILTTFDGERKVLIPVGMYTEYGYARSLSRFAAKLGPIAWKVASRKIEKCLPTGVKFGPGWVGENETSAEGTQPQLPTAVSDQAAPTSLLRGHTSPAPTQHIVEPCGDKSVIKPQDDSLPEVSRTSSELIADDGSTKAPIPYAVSAGGVGSKLNASEASSNSNTIVSRAEPTYPINHISSQNQSRVNGLNGSYGLNFATQMGKMIGATRPNHPSNTNLRISKTETQSLGSPSGDSKVPAPPDLNVRFQSPGSPGSGRTDSVHPDLALQL